MIVFDANYQWTGLQKKLKIIYSYMLRMVTGRWYYLFLAH